MPNSGQELSTFVQEEIENDEKLQSKLNDSLTTDRERDAINHTNSEMKKTIISEEKLTRVLFGNILNWFQAERTKMDAAAAKSRAIDEKKIREESSLTSDKLKQFSGTFCCLRVL